VDNPENIPAAAPRRYEPFPTAPPAAALEPKPDNPPWNSPAALGVWVASVLAIIILPAIFLIPYIMLQQPPLSPEAMVDFAKNNPTAVFLQVAATIPAHVLTLVLAWLVVTRGMKYSFYQTLGFERGGFKWWYYVLILGGFFGLAVLVGNFIPEQENELLRILRTSRATVYLVAFMATFTAPLVEEVVYRGVLYSAFQRALGVPAAFALVTFLFALVHVPQYYPSVATIMLLTLLSLILTAIRVYSGNLLPCIILHTVFNGIQSFLLVLEPVIKPATP
jgi:membrane protease YdiL (CAAX protease family)